MYLAFIVKVLNVYVCEKVIKQTSVYENSKQKMRPRKKVRCQDGKMCKKIHCVCFYSTVNFFSGPFEMTKNPNLSLMVARFPTEV